MAGFITSLPQATALTGAELLEVSQLSTAVTITGTTISAAASDNSYNDSANGFVAAGFSVGNRVKVVGFTGNVVNNITVGVIAALTAGKMTISGPEGDVIVDDAAGESVTIAKWVSHRVNAASLAAMVAGLPPKAEAGSSYTAALGDANSYVRFTSSSPVSFTIPPNSSVAFPLGTVIEVEQGGAGAVSIVAGAGVTINSRASDLTLAGQYAVAFAKKVGTDTWTVNGDL